MTADPRPLPHPLVQMRIAAAAAILAAGLAAAGLVAAGGATAADAPIAATPFDCVIEPRVIVRLASPVEGILEDVPLGRGDRVSAGDVVARLESGVEAVAVRMAEVRAGNDAQRRSSKARLEYQQRRASRSQELSRSKVVAESALDEVRTEAEVAELELREAEIEAELATLELDRAREQLDRRSIRSPVAGVVVNRALSAGEFAAPQSPIVEIAQIDPLNVEVFVPVDHYGRIAIGMAAEVSPEEPVGGRYPARVAVVDQVFDAASATFGVRLELANPDLALPAGLRCSVRFIAAAEAPR